jgi:hemolysin D
MIERLKKILSRLPGLKTALWHALRPEANNMVLRQSLIWSRAILWIIIGTFVAVVLWSFIAPLDEVIHATGKLEPRGSVRDLQSPVSGVIAETMVREGQEVAAGQLLVKLDPTIATAQLRSLEQRLSSMEAERSFYNGIFDGESAAAAPESVPVEIQDLAKNRAALLEENKLLRRLRDEIGALHETIKSSGQTEALSQTNPVMVKLQELKSLVPAVGNDGSEPSPDLQKLFTTEITNLSENYLRLKAQLEEARKISENRRLSFEAHSRLHKGGNLPKIDYLAHEASYFESIAKMKDLEDQAGNLPTAFRTEINNRIRENTNRINDIDSNLTKVRIDILERISQIESDLTAAREQLAYHEIKSPSDGVVFETLATKLGTVVAAKDAILRIIPSGELIAKVDIMNSDIGFVSVGMNAEVEVDTFPKREFGYIDGKIYFVGSDVLPPNDIKPFYSFPAKISLAKQSLQVRNKQIPLQSGMSVSVNLKVRKRVVANLFLDTLLGPVEGMRELR